MAPLAFSSSLVAARYPLQSRPFLLGWEPSWSKAGLSFHPYIIKSALWLLISNHLVLVTSSSSTIHCPNCYNCGGFWWWLAKILFPTEWPVVASPFLLLVLWAENLATQDLGLPSLLKGAMLCLLIFEGDSHGHLSLRQPWFFPLCGESGIGTHLQVQMMGWGVPHFGGSALLWAVTGSSHSGNGPQI